jgi:hypothetical protein
LDSFAGDTVAAFYYAAAKLKTATPDAEGYFSALNRFFPAVFLHGNKSRQDVDRAAGSCALGRSSR